jgi:hypothetical protein
MLRPQELAEAIRSIWKLLKGGIGFSNGLEKGP